MRWETQAAIFRCKNAKQKTHVETTNINKLTNAEYSSSVRTKITTIKKRSIPVNNSFAITIGYDNIPINKVTINMKNIKQRQIAIIILNIYPLRDNQHLGFMESGFVESSMYTGSAQVQVRRIIWEIFTATFWTKSKSTNWNIDFLMYVYASFKLTLDEQNLSSALDPNLWSGGVIIKRFFKEKKRHEENQLLNPYSILQIKCASHWNIQCISNKFNLISMCTDSY